MKRTEKAILADGRHVEYVIDPDKTMEGAMKVVYFTPDKSSVLCFFKDQSDASRRLRLDKVLQNYNPTLDSQTGDYWRQLFCWPAAIITSPSLGIMTPTYPDNYFFREGPWSGQEKKGVWFVRKTAGGKPFREMMPESERGTWLNFFSICIGISRAVWRLHAAGLAHSDLSHNNILIDPTSGRAVVIDIDSLVVPGIFPPDVAGTKGYIAPEVLGTMHLKINDPKRKHPSAATDQHALSVLIYQYLLFRHPLEGPKINSALSAEEDDLLSYGAKALYIEHPSDSSNRPKDLKHPSEVLGPHIHGVLRQSFVDGLHSPHLRPIAATWLTALLKTWELLHPCPNPKCTHKWFVLHDAKDCRCTFCGARIAGHIYKMKLRKETKPGQWLPDGELILYHGKNIHRWHVYDDVTNNERLKSDDKKAVADVQAYQGSWLFINRSIDGLMSPGGNRVPPGQAIQIKNGATFRMSSGPHGRMAEIEELQA